ncbi:unnamed protein product [Didymodactylos carnosus]|nr:unnamed protein product [Didymodactylos carnosus]CAF3531058.1 unnamed protein product [Didymodactylos carnosus]
MMRLEGYVKGYKRRFFQLSEDHRGVPGKPGRVVSLIPTNSDNDVVWGAAYLIKDSDQNTVRHILDEREKDGYTIIKTKFYFLDNQITDHSFNSPLDVESYLAHSDNPFWAGETASMEQIATQIAFAEGPSGKNSEYLFKLADAMRRMALDDSADEHLFTLERLVRQILKQ